MSETWQVAVTDPLHPDATAQLQRFAEPLLLAGFSRAERLDRLAGARAVIVRTPISVADVEAAPRLRLIVRHGTGLDFIPVETALARGIAVASVPDANSVSVAEYVIGAILCLARSLPLLDAGVRAGEWSIRQRVLGVELQGKTLGIVGVGRIGRLVAARAHLGLGMRLLGYDPDVASLPDYVECTESLVSLVERSDVVSLHVPLTTATRNLLDETLLARMKPGALLINAARGGLIDETALATALRAGRLRGAALDVLAQQPLDPGNPLREAPNVLFTPHAASLTEDAYRAMGIGSVQEVERAWLGKPLLNPVGGHQTVPRP